MISFRAEDVAGYAAVTKNGGQVRILDFHAGYSTTAMLEKPAPRPVAVQVFGGPDCGHDVIRPVAREMPSR